MFPGEPWNPAYGSGGLTVPQDILGLLKQPGFISIPQGSQRLRNFYVDSTLDFCCSDDALLNLMQTLSC